MNETPKLELEHVEASLTAAGYRRGHVSPQFDNCDALFYKGIRDAKGRRYQIEVQCYWGTRFPDPDYKGGLQIKLHTNVPFYHLLQHCIRDAEPETIALWESRCEQFFTSMGCRPYYERNEIEDGDWEEDFPTPPASSTPTAASLR